MGSGLGPASDVAQSGQWKEHFARELPSGPLLPPLQGAGGSFLTQTPSGSPWIPEAP